MSLKIFLQYNPPLSILELLPVLHLSPLLAGSPASGSQLPLGLQFILVVDPLIQFISLLLV